MTIINLKTHYPEIYTADCFLTVSKDIAEALVEEKSLENSQKRRIYWNKAHFSLDANDRLLNSASLVLPCLHEMYEKKIMKENLFLALARLPKKQCYRLYAHYFLGISKSKLALAEQVDESTIRESIECGLAQLRKKIKEIL